MKDFILALLIAKFSGVRKDGLAQLATALSLQADKEEDATALIEKISADKVNNFVRDWRSDVDKEVSTSTKTFEQGLKDKFDLVEKKGDEKPKEKEMESNDTPAWAKALIDANKILSDKINGFEGQEVNKTRLQTISEKLNGITDETFKAKTLKDFSRMKFDTDEEFNEYLTDTETDVTAFNQSQANQGLSGHGKPFMGGQNKDGVSSAVADFIASKTDDTKSMGGKEL